MLGIHGHRQRGIHGVQLNPLKRYGCNAYMHVYQTLEGVKGHHYSEVNQSGRSENFD